MNSDYIDFISAYCDRWCERCAFTTRCSAFAVMAATAMCGDLQDGLELALGIPQPVEPTAGSTEGRWIPDLDEDESTAEQLADAAEREIISDKRVKASPIVGASLTCRTLAFEWLAQVHRPPLLDSADPILREAIEIVGYDSGLIDAKLHRALAGLDEARYGDTGDDQPPGQEDWNGSAKVALISIERSTAAWLTIAQSTDDVRPGEIAGQLRDLQSDVERTFPAAWTFVRPGFDEIV